MGKIIQTNEQYWLKKRASRKTGFPLATIAFYGNDDQTASKVVVGVYANSTNEEPLLRKWFANEDDVREDAAIIQEIIDFLNVHGVYRISMLDRIFGCPHEEDIDYPSGEHCPQCPFWANRDRFTGQLIDS